MAARRRLTWDGIILSLTIDPVAHQSAVSENDSSAEAPRRPFVAPKVRTRSSDEIANASGMSVVPFVSRHSVYFANVPERKLAQSQTVDLLTGLGANLKHLIVTPAVQPSDIHPRNDRAFFHPGKAGTKPR